MNRLASFFTVIVFAALSAAILPAQDFGFGFDDEESSETSNASGSSGIFNFSVGGEIASALPFYSNGFSKGSDFTSLDDLASVKLNLALKSSFAEGIVNLKFQSKYDASFIDEAYIRAFFGSFDIEAGYRKLTWGKADNMGPLDVINPLDTSRIYTEMADNVSLMGVKIARPMVHASFRFGQFSKIEGIFIPFFKPHNIAEDGRWVPAEINKLKNPEIPMASDIADINVNTMVFEPDTLDIKYAQGGLRFTTTIGSADIGAQYYYGRMPQPAAKISLSKMEITNFNMAPMTVEGNADMRVDYQYNPYHQIGIDYAQVLFGFNVRAEIAANITEDLKGDDGSVYNPSIAWSVGFDRDLFGGINLNFQVNESIRLMHNKLGSQDISLPSDIYSNMTLLTEIYNKKTDELERIIGESLAKIDIEGGKPLTSTRLTAALSKKFLRDELELRAAFVWGIEDMDFLILPALIWTKDDLCVALSAGFFSGSKEGQLGQYSDNNFVKVSVKYTF